MSTAGGGTDNGKNNDEEIDSEESNNKSNNGSNNKNNDAEASDDKLRERLESEGLSDPNDSTSSSQSEEERDWEGSWSKLQRERSGGVFRLPDDRPREEDVYDRRIERLTSLWSNDTGFLIGIGVIFLIALFYIYVFYTGGISATPPVIDEM